MDTRSKIVDWPEAAQRLQKRASAGAAPKVVVGYFDPLLAAHARSLREAAGNGKAVVVVTSPARPLLDAAARQVLVAALECVEMVTALPQDRLRDLFDVVPETAVVSLEAEHARIADGFVRHVRNRHAS